MAWSQRRPPVNPIYRTREHRAARAALLEAFRPGDPCCLCGHPMWPTYDGGTSHLHADHDPSDLTRYRGLAHGSQPCQDCGDRCNVLDGARRGKDMQREKARPPRRWHL